MSSTLFTVASSCLLGVGWSLSCSTNSIGIDWTGSSSSASGGSSSDVSFQSGYSTSDCSDEVCAAAEYDIDIDLHVNNFLGVDAWDFVISSSLGVEAAFCGDSDICDTLAGGSDSCHAINFDFTQWYPTSCDADNDYDATTMDFNITYKYACCSTDDCNADYDFSTCDYNEELGDYVSGLYECWNGVREDIMKYLICDDDGNAIYQFEGNCRSDGDWIDSDDCIYILTCSDTWETVLTNFGECACDAATSNGYSGAVIAEIMETQWNSYCPSIDLSCSADGGIELALTRWYIYWTFYLHIEYSSINDDVRASIIAAIAAAANCNETLITIVVEVEGDTGNRRRRLQTGTGTDSDTSGATITVSIETETENDANSMETNLEGNADDEVSSQTGYNSTGGTGEVDSETTTMTGTTTGGQDSGSNRIKGYIISMASFMMLMIVFVVY